jgi:hypothetical protein
MLKQSSKKGVKLMNWITNRVKEMSTWSGASLIAMGMLILLGGPFVTMAAYACVAWGIISVIKKD